MKRITAIIPIFFLSSLTFGQNTPMEFLNAVPQPPSNLCNATMEQKMQFFDKIASFDTIFQIRMEEYSKKNEQFQEEHQDEATVNALIKAGYSREEAEKMKNLDNLSEEQQEALANQVMMNQYNMSMGEAKKVADYDTASQRRWAKAQSTMMMADAQYDSEKNTKKQLEIKKDLDLQQEIKWLQGKLIAGENKYQDIMRQIDSKADSAMSKLNPQIEKLYKDLNDGNGNSNQIINQIIAIRKEYCESFTPDYLETVEGFKVYIAENMEDYSELEKMQVELSERQVGIRNPDFKPGAIAMERVGSYRNLIGDAFKYNLNTDWGAQFIGY
jgi:hypothetical protein